MYYRLSKALKNDYKRQLRGMSVELVYKDGTKTLDKRIVRITDRYRCK